MPKVIISGYITRTKLETDGKTESPYIELDLMQFGDKEFRSEVIPIRVYNMEHVQAICKHYKEGEILELVSFCQVIKSNTQYKESLWVLREILQIGGNRIYVRERSDTGEARHDNKQSGNSDRNII